MNESHLITNWQLLAYGLGSGVATGVGMVLALFVISKTEDVYKEWQRRKNLKEAERLRLVKDVMES